MEKARITQAFFFHIQHKGKSHQQGGELMRLKQEKQYYNQKVSQV